MSFTDTDRLDFITQHNAWVSFAQEEANVGNPKPWRAQVFWSLNSFVREYADGESPRDAIDGLMAKMWQQHSPTPDNAPEAARNA